MGAAGVHLKQDIAVGDDRPFRRPGGAGGVDQHARILWFREVFEMAIGTRWHGVRPIGARGGSWPLPHIALLTLDLRHG